MVKRLTQLRQIDCTCPRNYQALESHWDVKRYKKKKKEGSIDRFVQSVDYEPFVH